MHVRSIDASLPWSLTYGAELGTVFPHLHTSFASPWIGVVPLHGSFENFQELAVLGMMGTQSWNDGYSKLQKSLSILLHSTSKILGDGGASRDALSPSLFAALGAGCWRPWFRMKKMTRKRRYINTKASSKELKGIAGRNQLTIQSRIQCQMPDRQVVPKDEGQEVKASAKAW